METRVSLVYQGVRSGLLSPERWVDLVAGAPARQFGLDAVKGAIRPGLDADIVVFDPEARRRLRAAALHSRSDHSPYEELEVVGWPALTISRGASSWPRRRAGRGRARVGAVRPADPVGRGAVHGLRNGVTGAA